MEEKQGLKLSEKYLMHAEMQQVMSYGQRLEHL